MIGRTDRWAVSKRHAQTPRLMHGRGTDRQRRSMDKVCPACMPGKQEAKDAAAAVRSQGGCDGDGAAPLAEQCVTAAATAAAAAANLQPRCGVCEACVGTTQVGGGCLPICPFVCVHGSIA
jgi:hypothetical protein